MSDKSNQVAGHADAECSECGSTFCETIMHEVPDSVGAHSMDIGFRLVCPYCWMCPCQNCQAMADQIAAMTEDIQEYRSELKHRG
jgi:hypothetical protein